ncbi:ATP-grasp domain-containing protein [Alteromonadaceae bacterium BrNp21-10]|nr:ATP-grasp domain-containing protein [Alteromonadaceae bacterium BrNp21-10]
MNNNLQDKTALVFGEDTRSFLSVIRSLAKAGMRVDVVTFSNLSPALKSKYINYIYYINYQAYSDQEWREEIEHILLEKDYDIAIPCDERALYPLIEFQKNLAVKTKFAVPDGSKLGPLFNKVETRLLAEKQGIPVAKGTLLDISDKSFKQLSQLYGSPIVLKPAQSYSSEKLNQRNSVQIAKTEADFEQFKQHNQYCLVESYFAGYGVGVSILAKGGEVEAAFAHARVSEPESGGGSSYRKAIAIDSGMLNACQKFCLALKYDGVAMFEFKFNPKTKDWILIEINARFWGSLPLAVFAGVDFPALYACNLLGITIEPKLTYNAYAYARNFTSDIYDIRSEFDVYRSKGLVFKGIQKALTRLSGFLRLVIRLESIDSLAKNDRAPFFAEFNDLFVDKINELPFFKNRKRQKTLQKFKQQIQKPISEILVVCYGNIMRSSFAGELLKQKLAAAGINDIQIQSYGFHQNENRSCPAKCIAMAKNWDVDLSKHQSKWLKQSHIKEKGQLIIIFDNKNEFYLKNYYTNTNALILASIIPPKYGFVSQIEDPYDHDEEYLHHCYKLIDISLTVLCDELKQVNKGVNR